MNKPRSVRNFWLEAETYGNNGDRQRAVKCGPTGNQGTMDITLYIREAGEVSEALTIMCREYEGKLRVMVSPSREQKAIGTAIHTVAETTR